MAPDPRPFPAHLSRYPMLIGRSLESSMSRLKAGSPLFGTEATTPALTAGKLRNRYAITVRTGWSLGLGGGFYDEFWGPETLHSLLEYRQGLLDLPCFSPYLRELRLLCKFLFDILHNAKLMVPVTVPYPGQRLGSGVDLIVKLPLGENRELVEGTVRAILPSPGYAQIRSQSCWSPHTSAGPCRRRPCET